MTSCVLFKLNEKRYYIIIIKWEIVLSITSNIIIYKETYPTFSSIMSYIAIAIVAIYTTQINIIFKPRVGYSNDAEIVFDFL